MKTENTHTFLGRILEKIRPSDLQHSENRQALSERVESLLAENRWDKFQFRALIRKEVNYLRTWLSDAKELTHETLAEICALLHISLGDLVTEQA